jgi:hypothetical protein
VITFTKWISGGSPHVWLAGVVGGDVAGDFAGEALTIQPTTNPNITSITRLVAIYEIHDHTGSHSFTAVIQGVENDQTGKALLDGVEIIPTFRFVQTVLAKFGSYVNYSELPMNRPLA